MLFARRISRIERLEKHIIDIRTYLEKELLVTIVSQHQDLVSLHLEPRTLSEINPNIKFVTSKPIAINSSDHNFPEGTAVDYTRRLGLCQKVEELFGRKVAFLDVGCSGGGLVIDFLIRGHFAIGIEGSDYSKQAGRAGWGIIPNNLFTADITVPFRIQSGDDLKKFEVISSWEVLEHIKTQDLDSCFKNVYEHLADDGIFVGSIGILPSFAKPSGEPLHHTIKEPAWWMNKLQECGFKPLDPQPFHFLNFCRGNGNGYRDPNFEGDGESAGFHFVVAKR